jgi:hypothetical protein
MPVIPAPPLDGSLQQVLIWIVVFLFVSFAAMIAWLAKYIALPMRDRHFQFMDKQEEFMVQVNEHDKEISVHNAQVAQAIDLMNREGAARLAMHRENTTTLARIEHKLADFSCGSSPG